MELNSIVFPAPTDDKYNEISNFKDQILFIPKKKDKTTVHIPCLFQKSTNSPNTNKIFIYFHGNAEDIFNTVSNSNIIKQSLPFDTLCMEYPGYSIYYGEKSAETIEEDSLIIYDFLIKECKYNQKDIIICGRSIGTGPATYLASQRKPGALILISPIKSLRDTVNNLAGIVKYLVKDRFNNFERIKEVTCPLLVIHGQKDSLIPYEDSIELTERTSGPYELMLPENMNHNNIHIYDDFLEPITNFLERYHLLIHNKNKIYIDEKYFELPEYLNPGNELSNNDLTSRFVRMILNI